jgi:hypothetical protein
VPNVLIDGHEIGITDLASPTAGRVRSLDGINFDIPPPRFKVSVTEHVVMLWEANPVRVRNATGRRNVEEEAQ